MRNLKRALSLTLASVMLLGMMVVGSSAAVGYPDVAEDDNVEAIEVVQSVGVMVGDENGNFRPGDSVSRAEMAVVMGKLLNLDYNYYSATCPFTDVSGVYDWARGWVGAAAANGIVSGRGDGIYDPAATVTAVEAASMMMRALGYFKYQNDYADGFEVATVRQGTTIGIFEGVGSSATAPMTRNQVAQMVLNALKSGMVQPDGNTINLTTPDGSVLTGKVNYVYVTSNQSYARAISEVRATSMGSTNDSPIVELGEQLYDGKLTLNDTALDVFQRPSRHWEYNGKDIGTYVKKELLRQEYTTSVSGKDLYELLSKATIDKYDFVIAIDGETEKDVLDKYGYFTKNNLIRSNTESVGKTGKGVLTQVYVDTENEVVYISVINTYLAKAAADYSEKKDEATFTVWKLHNLGTTSSKTLVKADNTTNLTVSGENFNVKDVKDGDIFLVYVADGEVQEMFDPEIVDEVTLNSFKKDSWVKADGTQYDYASSIRYDTDVLDEYDDVNMKDTQYRIYLDKYGYAIGIEIIEEPDQYVFLTGIDLGTSNLNNKTAEGNVIHLDGTMDTVKINMEKSLNAKGNKFRDGNDGLENKLDKDGNFVPAAVDKGTGISALMNTWCRYAVDKNGTYTLTEVANSDSTWTAKSKAGQGTDLDYLSTTPNAEFVKLDKSHIYLNGIKDSGIKRVYTNDNTVFLTVDTDEIVYKNLPGGIVDDTTAVIISDVESVGTGHQNVNLDAWNAAQVQTDGKYTTALKWTSNGVYNLFDDDGFVIAAVVVGEDAGTSTTYAYILNDDLIQEDYDSTNDEWTWYREAVVNGEVVMLTEKGETNPQLGDLGNGKGGQVRRGEWHEVKYKADGTVRSVTNLSKSIKNTLPGNIPAYDFDGYTYNYSTDPWDSQNGKLINDVKYVEAATDQFNTILLWDDLTDATRTISAEGHSLWVKTSAVTKDGFSINPSAKTVLIQDVFRSKDGLKIMGDINEYTGGIAGVKQALKVLNEDNDADYHEDEVGSFRGFVGAVFENGMATSIIIYDKTASFLNQGSDPSVQGTYTLTLKGNLIDKINPTSVEYILDGKRVEAVGLPYGTGDAARVVYEIPAIATGVVVYDADIVEAFDGWLNYDNHAVGTKDIRVIATPKTTAGGSATLNFDLKGNLTLNNVPTEGNKDGDIYTLTLEGNLADATVLVNGKNVTNEGKPTLTGTAFEIAKDADVILRDPDITITTVTVVGTDPEGNGISAETNATTNRMSFSMKNDITISNAPSAGDQLFAVHFGTGVTAEKFKDNTGAEVKARKVDGSTYYFKDDDNVMYISLATADSNNVMVLSDADKNNKVATTNVKASTKNGITVELAGGVLTGDIWVYQATKYDVDTTAAGAKIEGTTLTAGTPVFVKYGETVKVTNLTGITGIIAGGGSKRYGDNVADGLTAGTVDATLYGAYKVELKDICAMSEKTNTSNGTVGVELPPSTIYVKSGTVLYPKAIGSKGVTAVKADGTEQTAQDVTVNADISWTGMTKVTITAAKEDITVQYQNANGMTITTVGKTGDAVTVFVPIGTAINVDAKTQTLKVNTKTSANNTDADVVFTDAHIATIQSTGASVTLDY